MFIINVMAPLTEMFQFHINRLPYRKGFRLALNFPDPPVIILYLKMPSIISVKISGGSAVFSLGST